MNEYTKNLTIKNIERHTESVLYYMAQAAKAIQQGESPVSWLCNATQDAADLKVCYTRADDLDIYDVLDFKSIYKKALGKARAEVENDE